MPDGIADVTTKLNVFFVCFVFVFGAVLEWWAEGGGGGGRRGAAVGYLACKI